MFQSRVIFKNSSTAQNNFYGVLVTGEEASVTISNSVFSNNRGYGIRTLSTTKTRGNNTVINNGTNVSGVLTPLPGS